VAGKIIGDNSGVSSVLELIFTFVIASLIFTLIVMNLNPLLIDSPKYVVTENQFADVGNGVGTMMIDTYLIVPENGSFTTKFVAPNTVAGDPYVIKLNPTDANSDMEVSVYSSNNRVRVFQTLNAISSTITVNGTTNSTDLIHRIEYNTGGKKL